MFSGLELKVEWVEFGGNMVGLISFLCVYRFDSGFRLLVSVLLNISMFGVMLKCLIDYSLLVC